MQAWTSTHHPRGESCTMLAVSSYIQPAGHPDLDSAPLQTEYHASPSKLLLSSQVLAYATSSVECNLSLTLSPSLTLHFLNAVSIKPAPGLSCSPALAPKKRNYAVPPWEPDLKPCKQLLHREYSPPKKTGQQTAQHSPQPRIFWVLQTRLLQNGPCSGELPNLFL